MNGDSPEDEIYCIKGGAADMRKVLALPSWKRLRLRVGILFKMSKKIRMSYVQMNKDQDS